jgi:hypothetical protein
MPAWFRDQDRFQIRTFWSLSASANAANSPYPVKCESWDALVITWSSQRKLLAII